MSTRIDWFPCEQCEHEVLVFEEHVTDDAVATCEGCGARSVFGVLKAKVREEHAEIIANVDWQAFDARLELSRKTLKRDLN